MEHTPHHILPSLVYSLGPSLHRGVPGPQHKETVPGWTPSLSLLVSHGFFQMHLFPAPMTGHSLLNALAFPDSVLVFNAPSYRAPHLAGPCIPLTKFLVGVAS